MTTSDQLLATAGWRRRHSVYTMWALAFGFGFVSLFYTGARAKRPSWVLWGALYGVLALGGLTINSSMTPKDSTGPTSPLANLAMVIWLVTWIISAVHVFALRKDWLRWKAEHQQGPRWYEQESAGRASSSILGAVGIDDPTGEYLAPPSVTVSAPASPAAQRPPMRPGPHLPPPPSEPPGRLPQPSPPPPAPPPENPRQAKPADPSPAPVDLNTASVEVIAALPGLGIATAHRIVDERARRGGFSSVDDAAAVAALPPHIRAKLPRYATVSPPAPRRSGGSAGRVVDL